MKSSGLKGRMKVKSYVESPDILRALEDIRIGHEDANPTPYKVKNIAVKGSGSTFFLEVEGVDACETADELRGQYVIAARSDLDELHEDEFYWHDIIGLIVTTIEGHTLGTVTSIIPTGSNDVYVCTADEREILIPAIDDVIKQIDIARGVMIVELLEGL